MTKLRLLIWGMSATAVFTVVYLAITIYHIRGQASTVTPIETSSTPADQSSGTTTTANSTQAAPAPSSTGSTSSGDVTTSPSTTSPADSTTTPAAPAPEQSTPSAAPTTGSASPSDASSTSQTTAGGGSTNTAPSVPTSTSTSPTVSSTKSTVSPQNTAASVGAAITNNATEPAAVPIDNQVKVQRQIINSIHLRRVIDSKPEAGTHLNISFLTPFPDADVELVIQSNPFKTMIRTNKNGAVSYDFKGQLEYGQHAITVNATDPVTKQVISARRFFNFERVKASDILDQPTSARDTTSFFDLRYLAALMVAVLVAFAIVYSIYRQNLDKSEEIMY